MKKKANKKPTLYVTCPGCDNVLVPILYEKRHYYFCCDPGCEQQPFMIPSELYSEMDDWFDLKEKDLNG